MLRICLSLLRAARRDRIRLRRRVAYRAATDRARATPTGRTICIFRRNSKGIAFERWRHARGCRQWFNVARDNVTHEIRAIYRMDEPKPVIADGENRL